MGVYLNPGNDKFYNTIHKKIYVDKSLLIKKINYIKEKMIQYICVSRPSGFGKSSDANMLVAYYSKGCDASDIFDHLKIAQTDMYQKHLNKHNVIHLNMQSFLSKTHDIHIMIVLLTKLVFRDIKKEYNNIDYFDETDIIQVFEDVYSEINEEFIFVIDEWDYIFRKYPNDYEGQQKYLKFLKALFKGKPYINFVYMTGILPIRKSNTYGDGLDIFYEYSMISNIRLEEFMGLTEYEVKILCQQHNMNYKDIEDWYGGYKTENGISVFNHEVIYDTLLHKGKIEYLTHDTDVLTLKNYINKNLDGLKEDIMDLISGKDVFVNTYLFKNDMVSFKFKDDILTLLVHLGYLGYRQEEFDKFVYIPNQTVKNLFIKAIENINE